MGKNAQIRLQYICYICAMVWLVEVNSFDHYTEKPKFLPSCKIYEPGFTKCSTNAVQHLIEQLVIGIPELTERFGSFDPIYVKNITFKQDNNEVVTIRVNLTNVILKGFAGLRCKESKISKKDFSWQTKLFVPKLRVDADYDMHGRILIIPLNGSGQMFIEMENVDILLHTETRLYDKDGFTFENVTNVRVQLNLTSVHTELSNFFNGNSKEVERSTNQFFNDNWRDFYESLKPLIIQTIESLLYEQMYFLFNLIPANFFVEDIPTAEQFYSKKVTT